MIATSLASVIRPLWRLLERYKIDPASVFQQAGLNPALMDEPRGRYRVEQAMAVWSRATEMIDDPCFGLKIAETWSPTDLHALGYAFLASSTLRTALERLSRYVRILIDVRDFEIQDHGEKVSFTLRTEHPAFLPPPIAQEDATLAFIISLCRASYGERLNPVEVRLQHRGDLPCAGEYYGFFRCPIQFDSAVTAILFSSADLDRPLPTANWELARANDRILSDFLDELTGYDLITLVKKAITEALPSGSPTDESIAETLSTSPRTLQRKLAVKGVTYAQLLDTVRRELAEQYVVDPSRSLREITYLLGFAELSEFSRAFKRWTGQAPSEIREAVNA